MNDLEAELRDEEARLGFVITKLPEKHKGNLPHGVLFMVDRDRTRKKWWTPYLSQAMYWNSEAGANNVASKLRFGHIEVKGRTEFHR
jgi:hypothetical protein